MTLDDVRDRDDLDGDSRDTAVDEAISLQARSGSIFWRPGVRRILYTALAFALLYAGIKVAGGFTDAYHQLDGANLWWLLPAFVAVVIRFAVLGIQLSLLRGPSTLPERPLAMRIALVAFGLGGMMPASPAEGFALSTAVLRKRGMTSRQSWLMLASSQWMTFWALIIVFAVDRVAASAAGELHHRQWWSAVITSTILLAASAGVAWLLRRPATIRIVGSVTRWLPGRKTRTSAERADAAAALYSDIQRTLGDRRNRVMVTLLACLARLADGAILWCMLQAVHAHVPFGVAVVAYVVAMVVAWVPLLP
ncbi:MAG TPA: lysylphosphatidylglycerol synthase domain-containing protein, partial [Ilumatobacteraceae bacterium]